MNSAPSSIVPALPAPEDPCALPIVLPGDLLLGRAALQDSLQRLSTTGKTGRAAMDASQEALRLASLHSLSILDTANEEEYDDLTRLAAYICGTSMSLISLVDLDRQWFKSRVGCEIEGTPRSESICTHTVQQDDLFIVEDALSDERFQALPLVASGAFRFYAGSPIRSPEGYNVGSLCVLDKEPRTLSAEQKQALQVLSRQAAAYLLIRAQAQQMARSVQERLAAEQELRKSKDLLEKANGQLLKLASTDALTGLANRRVMEADLLKKQHPGADPALSLLMIDVDHFKRINDTLCHETGDRVLRRIADLLRASTRETDTVCRYGGEEFVVLMPGTDHATAMDRAERLRNAVAQDEQPVVAVTVSIGVATARCATWGVEVQELLAAADRALYEAKHEGRNCVRSAGPATEADGVQAVS